LSLPHGGFRENVIRTKVFQEYIKDNVGNWFHWSKKMKLPVKHMKDLILVSGCTLVTSWAAAVFDGSMSVDSNATTISLDAKKSGDGGVEFFWRNIRGNVEYHNSHFDPVRPTGYLLAMNLCFLLFFVLECSRNSTPEPMRLYKGLSCKAHLLPGHTNTGCSRTPS
jgi:hypothetical protein